MANERVRFQGDPVVGSTGSEREADIPLNKNVPVTSVQMLAPDEDVGGKDAPEEAPPPNKGKKAPVVAPDGDEEAVEETGAPDYSRESIGARVSLAADQQQAAAEAEKVYDTEDCKACLFPRFVKLQHEGLMHEYAAGVHMVPVSIAGEKMKDMHWWLKQNGVRHVGAGLQPNPRKPEDE